MTKFYPVKFCPIPMERIWGGHQLKSWFDVNTPKPIGEYWVLSGHPNGTSIVTNGDLAGLSLVDLCKMYPEAYLGCSPQSRFPLLVKFLEASSDLSVQIHPDDAYAQQVEGDYGKTEAWYVLDCPKDGKVHYGHSFTSKEEYQQAVSAGRVKDYLVYQNIEPEQLVFVPARTMHALLAGTTVIEVQQTSDVTYRVYDWDRVDGSGQPRELHVDKASDVLKFQEANNLQAVADPTVIHEQDGIRHDRLVSCPYFTLETLKLRRGNHHLALGNIGNPDVLIVAAGCGKLVDLHGNEVSLNRGDTLLIPSTLDNYEIHSDEPLTVIRTYY